MRTTTIVAGQVPLRVYVADAPRQWRQGLIGCDTTDVDGMLFVFPGDIQIPFQMHGMSTPVLLTCHAATGALVDLTYLRVDAEPYQPNRPYRYALELVGYHASDNGVFDVLPELLAGLTIP